MKFTKITAKNFLSFKELEYGFVDKPVLIQGENLTEDSQESNGSGKSAIQAAIEFALFRSTSKAVPDAELIFWGETEAEISLTIDCGIRRERMRIIRTLRLNKASTAEIQTAGEDGVFTRIATGTVNDADNFIIEWIGISKADLQNYFILNKERYKSFFYSSNKEKIEMINRFSNAKIIDGIDKLVKDDVDIITGKIKVVNEKKITSIAKVKLLKSQLEQELSRNIEQEQEDEILAIEKLIDIEQDKIVSEAEVVEYRKGMIDQAKETHAANVLLIETHNQHLDGADKLVQEYNTKFEELIKRIENEDAKIKIAENNKEEQMRIQRGLLKQGSDLVELIEDIKKTLAGTVTCPKCQHRFNYSDATIDVAAEEATKDELTGLLESTQKKADECREIVLSSHQAVLTVSEGKKALRELEIKMTAGIRTAKLNMQDLENKRNDIVRQNKAILTIDIPAHEEYIRRANESAEHARNRIETLRKQRAEIKNKPFDMSRIEQLMGSMYAEGKTLRTINTELRDIKKQEYETAQWILNFKKFNMYLANQSLKIIQGYCNKFLTDVKSDLQVKWEGMKLLANNELREEITPYIIRGENVRKFFSFSGGERARMDYSMIFTLQEMINKTNKWGGLQFLSTDEIAEGLDSLGLSDLMKSLGHLNKAVLITTHVVNRNIGDNILTVKKINGISKIV